MSAQRESAPSGELGALPSAGRGEPDPSMTGPERMPFHGLGQEHSRKCRCVENPTCVYCDMPVSTRHEHDHFPIPKRAGGVEVYPVCVNCHDLKDRVPLDRLDPALVFTAMMQMPPLGRIILAKVVSMAIDQGVVTPIAHV